MGTAALPITSFRMEAPDPDPEPQPRQEPESRPSPGPAPRQQGREQQGDDEVSAMRREMDELRQTNRSLIDLVGRNTPKAPAAPARTEAAEEDGIDWGEDAAIEDDPDEPEDPAALVDDISKLGREALAKRGFMRKADVVKLVREESRKAAVTASRQVVGRARQQATTESTIMSEFPDLANPESELFKATIPHVNAAARFDKDAAKNPVTLYLAAKTAKAELEAKKAGNRRASARDDDDDEGDREPVRRSRDDDRDDRDLRIRSQQGDRGRQRSRIESEDNDDVPMSSDARAVAKMMGLSDEEYRTEAKRVKSTQTQRRGR